MTRTASSGDQLCSNVNNPTPRNNRLMVLHGRPKDVTRLIGIQNIRLAMSTDDPNQPCSDGDKSRSLAMSGRRIPSKKMIPNEVPTQEVRDRTRAHRLSLGLSGDCCNSPPASGCHLIFSSNIVNKLIYP